MSRVKVGKFLQSWCRLLQTVQLRHNGVMNSSGVRALKILHSLIAGDWGRWVLPRSGRVIAECWWLLDLWVWEAKVWVESKGCANSGRGRDDECGHCEDIALFSLFTAGGCIDKPPIVIPTVNMKSIPSLAIVKPPSKCDLFSSLPTIRWIGSWSDVCLCRRTR